MDVIVNLLQDNSQKVAIGISKNHSQSFLVWFSSQCFRLFLPQKCFLAIWRSRWSLCPLPDVRLGCPIAVQYRGHYLSSLHFHEGHWVGRQGWWHQMVDLLGHLCCTVNSRVLLWLPHQFYSLLLALEGESDDYTCPPDLWLINKLLFAVYLSCLVHGAHSAEWICLSLPQIHQAVLSEARQR